MIGSVVNVAKSVGAAIAPKVPAIGLVAGIVAIGAGVVLAVKSAVKYSAEDEEELMEEIDEINAEYEERIERAQEKEAKVLNRKRKWKIRWTKIKRRFRGARHYIRAIVAFLIGVLLILGSFGLMRRANLKLIGSLAAVTEAANKYRERIEELDPEAHAMATFGTSKDSIEVNELGEDGETHRVKYESADVITGDGVGGTYARIFDRTTAPDKYATDQPAIYNESFLKGNEQWLRNELPNRKFIRYNEALRRLGMEECEAGDSMGWAPDLGDGTVDLRIRRIFRPNGDGTYDTVFGIDPNVVNISSKMKWGRKF